MVISRIIGGLGNQMFQYASGRALAIRLNTELYLDISDFKNYKLHNGFELNTIFNCEANIAGDKNIEHLLGIYSNKYIRKMLLSRLPTIFHNKNIIIEPDLTYWDGINNIKSDCYLVGYWQSEKYFKHVKDTIIKDFTFKNQMDAVNTLLSKQIEKVNSVSLHVRRGDYVTNKKTYSTHGLCTNKYYSDAIQYINERVDNPHFYIFSDDLEWSKKNLQLHNYETTYVENNYGKSSYIDMQLMSMCKHNIIANSSFSWWGAYLNNMLDKIVISPKRWFSRPTHDSTDLIPDEWIRL